MNYTIFCERIFDDKCFEALKSFINKHPGKTNLFLLTPVNHALCVAEQGYTGTKEELSSIMKDRYRELSFLDCRIGLHLHLGLRLENIDQQKMFSEACEWMRIQGFSPKLWTSGWYIHNSESVNIARSFGMEYFNDWSRYSFHDYEYGKIYKLMMIITNIRGIFRKWS